MSTLILIPEERLLLSVAIYLGCLSPSAVASRLIGGVGHLRWDLRSSHLVTLVVLAVGGSGALQSPFVVAGPHWGWAVGLVLGIPLGSLAFDLDQRILRRHRRQQLFRRATPRGAHGPPSRSANAAHGDFARPWHLMVIGMLEEVVFRGVLLGMTLHVDGSVWRLSLWVLVTLAFAANHIPYGPIQVVAKLPLSALTGALTLLTGSVVGAALAHAWFNRNVALGMGLDKS